MVQYDTSRARAAVQFLVDSPYFAHHILKLRNSVVKPRALPFRDEAEPLNELLVIGRQSVEAMENLIQVAEFKRSDRNDYQREYMAAKRKRDRKVIALEEAMTGQKLPAEARLGVLRNQYKVWNKERDRFLAALHDLDWAARNERLKDFWAGKEAEIEALAQEALQRGPVKGKRTRAKTR